MGGNVRRHMTTRVTRQSELMNKRGFRTAHPRLVSGLRSVNNLSRFVFFFVFNRLFYFFFPQILFSMHNVISVCPEEDEVSMRRET